MQLDTRYFGMIEIDEKDIIDFPEGIPGFEDVKKFVLLGNTEEGSPFEWLQGVDNTDLALVVINPYIICENYVVDVDDSEVEILDIEDVEKVSMYAIVVVPEDITEITANLKAPILINNQNNTGKQVVMDNGDYPIKYYFVEMLRELVNARNSEKSPEVVGG